MSALPAESTEPEAPSGRPRDLLCQYVCSTLYKAPIGKEALPRLCLPWPTRQPPRITEADLYTAGPGEEDRKRPPAVLGRDPVLRGTGWIIPLGVGPTIGSPMAGDPTMRQAERLEGIWPEYLKREAAAWRVPQREPLRLELDTVARLVELLGGDDHQIISELGQGIHAKQSMQRHQLSRQGLVRRRNKALDNLLALVYQYGVPRR